MILGGGPKEVLAFRSADEIKQNLSDITKQLTDADHPYLKIIRKAGDCWHCQLKPGENPDIASFDCPHIRKGSILVVNQHWTLDTRKLQQEAVPA
ncbi:MAG: hypothetical protein NTY04_00915 [Candidatus Staskawiczbacteria bacterium]|nr:hypothetical protein [Candidatus Staskawiczbacteria bacterium]